MALYKGTASIVRAFANIADELEAAGYDEGHIRRIKKDVDRYVRLRETIRNASGETIDLRTYEADMRHLIDTYIEADRPRTISPFDGLTLLEIILRTGIEDALGTLPDGIKGNRDAAAETIENNVRSKIIKEHLNDPAYYERMSAQLQEIIDARKAKAIGYEEYLKQVAELARRAESGRDDDTPAQLDTPGKRALYNNPHGPRADGDPQAIDLSPDEALELAVRIDETVRRVRSDAWRGEQAREQVIKAALHGILQDEAEVERLFLIIFEQKREY